MQQQKEMKLFELHRSGHILKKLKKAKHFFHRFVRASENWLEEWKKMQNLSKYLSKFSCLNPL